MQGSLRVVRFVSLSDQRIKVPSGGNTVFLALNLRIKAGPVDRQRQWLV